MTRIFTRTLLQATITAALALGTIRSAAPLAAQQSTSGWHGLYSDAQAKRGEALYARFCANCHGRDLEGGDRAPAVGGPAFTAKWSSRPVGDLLGFIQVSMPLNSPGAIGRQQNADILAFMMLKSGIPSGAKELAPRPGAEPLEMDPPLPPGPIAVPLAGKRFDAYYSDNQALRGKAAFNRNCAYCHTVDPKLSTPEDLVQALPRTFGGHFLERIVNGKRVYPNVYVLYSKLQSMPATDTKSITEETRVDIVAYILQANGYPSGPTEIAPNADAMKLMNLNEDGFEPIFNGKDLSGLRFRFGLRNDPGSSLSVENGVLACNCNVHGTWASEKRYKNFVLRLDTRFERPADWSGDDELFSGGSGVLILGRPTGNGNIEIEGRHRDFLQVFAIGGKAEWSFDLEARRRVLRPLGEWNSLEIVSRDGQVKVSLNGTPITSITSHDYTEPGHIFFQSQGARMYWRNVRVKPE